MSQTWWGISYLLMQGRYICWTVLLMYLPWSHHCLMIRQWSHHSWLEHRNSDTLCLYMTSANIVPFSVQFRKLLNLSQHNNIRNIKSTAHNNPIQSKKYLCILIERPIREPVCQQNYRPSTAGFPSPHIKTISALQPPTVNSARWECAYDPHLVPVYHLFMVQGRQCHVRDRGTPDPLRVLHRRRYQRRAVGGQPLLHAEWQEYYHLQRRYALFSSAKVVYSYLFGLVFAWEVSVILR